MVTNGSVIGEMKFKKKMRIRGRKVGKRGRARAGAAASVTEPGTAHVCAPGIPVELR